MTHEPHHPRNIRRTEGNVRKEVWKEIWLDGVCTREQAERLANHNFDKQLNGESTAPRFANFRDGGNLNRRSFDLGVQHVLVGFVLTLLGVGLVLAVVLIAGWL